MATFAADTSAAPPLPMSDRVRLSVMMFLQFAVWGAWFTVFVPYLKHLRFDGAEAGALIGNMALGAIFSSFVAGFIADRLIDARFIMAGCHLAGAALLYFVANTQSTGQYWTLYALTFVYSLLYNPTLVLANTITFRHVPSSGRDFPGVRVFGTIGWIVAGLAVDYVVPLTGLMPTGGATTTNMPLLFAAVLSLALGVYSLTLPKTPPTGSAGDGMPIAKAFGLFRNPSFAVFFTVSFAITVVLAFYFYATGEFLEKRAGVASVAATMTIGQVCELIFMPLLPLFLFRLGMKWVLALGMFSWGVRYLCFSQGGPAGLPFALAIVGVALHGVCFDFFFAAGFIYCDNEAPRDIRASAQALFSFLTYGVGMWIGTLAAGRLTDYYTTEAVAGTKVVDWQAFWLVPAVGVLICFAVFVLFFRTGVRRAESRTLAATATPVGASGDPGI